MGFLLNPYRLFIPSSGNIQFVGRISQAGPVSSKTVSLTSLTGGIGSSAIADDFVVGICAASSAADRNPSISTTGYTQFTDLTVNDTNRVMLYGAWKFMTSTPDTQVDASVGGVDSSGSMILTALVFRGVNLTTPLDTFTEGGTDRNTSGGNSADPNPLSGTPQTSGAKMLIMMAAAHTAGAVNLSQSYLSDAYVDNRDGSTRDVSVAYGTVDWTGGTYDPAAATLAGGTINDSWAASFIALRPA